MSDTQFAGLFFRWISVIADLFTCFGSCHFKCLHDAVHIASCCLMHRNVSLHCSLKLTSQPLVKGREECVCAHDSTLSTYCYFFCTSKSHITFIKG